MSAPLPDRPNVTPDARRTRQKRTLLALAILLVVGGLVVLFALKRVALPMRIMIGLGDVFAGIVLLVVYRQKVLR